MGGSVVPPPPGGTEPFTAAENHPVVPAESSWVDELTVTENGDPPGDLWPESKADDGIPF